jgi:alpha-galactosidase
MKYLVILFILLVPWTGYPQKYTELALTPPMGWNSHNTFGVDVNEALIMEIADAMVQTGMAKVGYQYIIIDDGWASGRDEEGNLIPDPKKFPGGMKTLADYIHGKGLKLGICADAGIKTCGGFPGSRGYEYQDARNFARWGIDYLKYDWCNTGTQSAKDDYWLMSDAIRKAGRPMVFGICEWGTNEPWKWAKNMGHSWRTTSDISDTWDGKQKQGEIWTNLGWTLILDQQSGLEVNSGTGAWNDPGILEVGSGGMSIDEYRTHFTMWCMLAAPLMAGNDLRNMEKPIIEILTNADVIAVDQDKMGKQGYKIVDQGDYEVWTKDLEKGDAAYCFLNRSQTAMPLTIDWKKLGVLGYYKLKDLWAGKNAGTTQSVYQATLPPHSVILLRLTKK